MNNFLVLSDCHHTHHTVINTDNMYCNAKTRRNKLIYMCEMYYILYNVLINLNTFINLFSCFCKQRSKKVV